MKRTLILALLLFAILVPPTFVRAADPAPPATQSEAKATTQPAKTLTLEVGNKVTMKLVLIPAGKFIMGSPEGGKDKEPNEWPQHEVTISKPFYMGVYEVTQEQYEAVVGKNPSQFKGAQNPVEMVSWDEAVAFCKKLSETSGKKVRLPTEAEWEYACRAGSKTRFYFGDDDTGREDYACRVGSETRFDFHGYEKELDDFAWYSGNSGKTTHPVGQKKANAWGLYDMHGNVWEWCADWYDEYGGKYYANSPKADPTGPAEGRLRVLRGGSRSVPPRLCRSATRVWNIPSGRDVSSGFRAVVAAGLD